MDSTFVVKDLGKRNFCVDNNQLIKTIAICWYRIIV